MTRPERNLGETLVDAEMAEQESWRHGPAEVNDFRFARTEAGFVQAGSQFEEISAHEDWNGDMDRGTTEDERDDGEQVKGAVEQGSAEAEAGGEVEAGVGGVTSAGVNQTLARLEMTSLEVKLYLDSIDQRISRMEPRLEEMRGGEAAGPLTASALTAPVEMPGGQGAGIETPGMNTAGMNTPGMNTPGMNTPGVKMPAEQLGAEARTWGSGTWSSGEGDAAGPPRGDTAGGDAMPTAERRRRAQGVPVERRRAPHAIPVELEEIEPWATTVKPWILAHRAWMRAALLGLLAVAGLIFWGSGKTSTKDPVGTADAGAVLSSASRARSHKSSGDVPWSQDAGSSGSMQTRGGRTGGAGRVGPPPVGGKVVVEQGVVAPLGAGGIPTPVAPTVTSDGNASSGPETSSGSSMAGSSGASTAGISSQADPSTLPGDSTGGGGAAGDTSTTSHPANSPKIVAPAAGRVHVSSGIMAGNLISSHQPAYPGGFARLFHAEGRVVMQAIVSKNGRVENLRVISGSHLLRGAAKDAVRTWRYRPYYINGSAVEVATIVSVEFHR